MLLDQVYGMTLCKQVEMKNIEIQPRKTACCFSLPRSVALTCQPLTLLLTYPKGNQFIVFHMNSSFLEYLQNVLNTPLESAV